MKKKGKKDPARVRAGKMAWAQLSEAEKKKRISHLRRHSTKTYLKAVGAERKPKKSKPKTQRSGHGRRRSRKGWVF